jgi:hypothetical protein
MLCRSTGQWAVELQLLRRRLRHGRRFVVPISLLLAWLLGVRFVCRLLFVGFGDERQPLADQPLINR